MAWSITLTGKMFEGEDAAKKEREFLDELRHFFKGKLRSGNFYGDYIGHFTLIPYRKLDPYHRVAEDEVEEEVEDE